jgi:hypothetical protein
MDPVDPWRRFIASSGPTHPRSSIGIRSHHALKIAIVACMSPTFACSATASGRPVTRVSAVRKRDGRFLVHAQQKLGPVLPRWLTRLSCSPRKLGQA